MFSPHHKNAGQNYNIKITDTSLVNVAKFEYFETPPINQDLHL
jgi:hypothetical protein